jgi:hypothetical protein
MTPSTYNGRWTLGPNPQPALWIRIAVNADPDPTFISMRIQILIRIQGATLMRVHADPNPGQTLTSQKLNFYMKNTLEVGNGSKTYQRRYKAENQVYLLILVNFPAPGSGSAFPPPPPHTDPDPG